MEAVYGKRSAAEVKRHANEKNRKGESLRLW
jgi:hypothetical protein